VATFDAIPRDDPVRVSNDGRAHEAPLAAAFEMPPRRVAGVQARSREHQCAGLADRPMSRQTSANLHRRMSMAQPRLYGPSYSTYTRTVRMALEEKGVGYATEEIDIMKPRPASYLAMQPWGKVPVLDHDGFKLHETGAITRYIDETFGGAKLQPVDAKKRARMNQVMGIMDSYAYPSMVSVVTIERLFNPKADEAKIAEAMPSAEKSLDALEGLIGESQYLAGDDVSLADLMAVPIFDYFAKTPEGKAAIAKRRKVAAWWERIQKRPSVAKTKFG
jgi:glutathione S-transferase